MSCWTVEEEVEVSIAFSFPDITPSSKDSLILNKFSKFNLDTILPSRAQSSLKIYQLFQKYSFLNILFINVNW
jgi:hypothetical protein